MAYFTVGNAREAFARTQSGRTVRKAAREVLRESVARASESQRFDVFLSHCLVDAELIAGVKALLEEQGFSVYVDWIVDRQLDRHNVSRQTADIIRNRMRASESMVFASSDSSPDSKWMPWELGYFDGLRQGRIAVLPLVQSEGGRFEGQEYLGLYPLVERLGTNSGKVKPFVTQGAGTRTYMDFSSFRDGKTAFKSMD